MRSRAARRPSEPPCGCRPAALQREAAGPAPARVPPAVRQALASHGEPLDTATRGAMESRFGHDFSRVRVHADSAADLGARSVNARAFTVGPDIVFSAGAYVPHTGAGALTLAHELAHTVQQGGAAPAADAPLRVTDPSGPAEREAASAGARAAWGERVRVTGSTAPAVARQPAAPAAPPAPPPETPALRARLDGITAQYVAMIADARSQGYNVAADNLQRFLDGTGGTRTLSVPWLRGFSEVTGAERTNQARFESSLGDQAEGVATGATRAFHDHWDRSLTGGLTTELYYASGTSTIRSTGDFSLHAPRHHEVDITGTVQHHWFDPYDWHAGLGAYIPGHGSISDADALLLQTHRGARPFHMEADWTQRVSGHVTVRDYWFDSSSYTWTGP